MNATLTNYLILPMPFLWLLLLGLALWPWRRLRNAFLMAAVALFVVFSLPATGMFLISWLAAGAPRYDNAVEPNIAAIVVPTGGTFDDGSGQWWATKGSLRRMSVALRLQARLGLPIILSGGSSQPGQPPEARIIAALLNLEEPEVMLETTARNSSETGRAMGEMFAQLEDNQIVLVTSATHIARMSASMRHHGVRVLAVPVGDAQFELSGILDLLPSYRGLRLSRSALWELMAIAWYLSTDRIDLDDLSRTWDR